MATSLLMAIVALTAISCDKEIAETPVNKPTIGIQEPEFDKATMKVKVMIVPSTDATAWYWRVDGGSDTLDEAFTKVEGAVAQQIEFTAVYGVEYTIRAYAENAAGKSDMAEKKFCAMPEGEVSVSIGDITMNDEEQVMVTIYPSQLVTAWYWKGYDTANEEPAEWNMVEGNAETTITIPYEWNSQYTLKAYAECGELKSDETTKEYCFELAIPTISVSKPIFDESAMQVSFDVTPSEGTHHWIWGVQGGSDIREEGDEPKRVSFDVKYDTDYAFEFVAVNRLDIAHERTVVEFKVISPVADIAIENLTAYTLDAVITKKEHCVRYVAGAVHTSAYDRNVFIEQAQSSLDPDPSYPFAVFNSSTESRTFSEQDLVRNSRTDSDINAGIMLVPGTSFTIAVYGEDENGNYNVSTKEVVIPAAEINGNVEVAIEMSDITETSATATVTAEEPCKLIIGFVDPNIMDTEEDSFEFEGATEEEIKHFIASRTQSVPSVYTEPITRLLSDRLEIDHEYYAYAIAIKDGKIGEVAYTTFRTRRPSLTGSAKIISASIDEQITHETLTVTVTPDANATKVRIYAAPSADHAAYADNLEYVMDADSYQNYREEYEIVDGVATAVIDIYHPGDNYYIYASAVDATGRAGEIVCVARMMGLDTDYYTTIEEVIEEGSLSYYGTGSALLTASNEIEANDRVSVTLTATMFSSNVDKVWFMRLASCKIDEIESGVKSNLAEYANTGKIKGSYKSVTEGWAYNYIDNLENSFNPTYEALLKYDETYGGDIIVMVILDTDGKVKIHSYYAGGKGVVEM